MMRFLFIVLLLAGVWSCGNRPLPNDFKKGDPDWDRMTSAPYPYTAEQIRAATRVGVLYRWLSESPKQLDMHEYQLVIRVTSTKVVYLRVTFNDIGTLWYVPRKYKQTFAEVAYGIKFPVDSTTIKDVVLSTPAGDFPCKLYIVTDRDRDGAKQVTHYYFARDLPGPPIKTTKFKNGRQTSNEVLVGLSYEEPEN